MQLKNICQAQEHTHQFTSQFHKVCKILYYLHILEPVHPSHLVKNKITPWTYFSDSFGNCLTRLFYTDQKARNVDGTQSSIVVRHQDYSICW